MPSSKFIKTVFFIDIFAGVIVGAGILYVVASIFMADSDPAVQEAAGIADIAAFLMAFLTSVILAILNIFALSIYYLFLVRDTNSLQRVASAVGLIITTPLVLLMVFWLFSWLAQR